MENLEIELKKVYAACFDDSDKYIEYAFSTKFGTENCLYELVNGKVAAELFIIEKKLILDNKVVDCPYICGVCTLPEMRRLGLAERLMERAHTFLKSKGYTVCGLHPFRHSFYEKFGYVTYNKVHKLECGKNIQPNAEKHIVDNDLKEGYYNINTENQPLENADKNSILNNDLEKKNFEIHYKFKIATEKDLEIINNIYNQFMTIYNGYVFRGIKETTSMFYENTADGTCFLIYKNDFPIGYYYTFEGDREIVEFCCNDLSVLNCEELNGFIVNIPYNIDVSAYQHETVDFTMLKILDAEKFIREITQTHKESAEKYNLIKDFSEQEFVLAATGAYEDFDIRFNEKVTELFYKKNNYVFDKY